jgi:hypothetical protein
MPSRHQINQPRSAHKITLDASHHLLDSGGSLNEGKKMDESALMKRVAGQLEVVACKSEAGLNNWAEGKFRVSGSYTGELYGNTDWALARVVWSAALATRDARIAELEDGLHAAHNRVARYADEREQLRAELAGLKSETADLESDLEQITDHNIELQSELERSRACLSRVDAENSALNAKLAALRQQVPYGYFQMVSMCNKNIPELVESSITFRDDPGVFPLYYAVPAPAVVMPDINVTAEGVRFGKAWFSHEAITGFTAEQLNTGECRIVGRAYMDWVNARLNAVQS